MKNLNQKQLRELAQNGKIKFFRKIEFVNEFSDDHYEYFYFSIDEYDTSSALVSIYCFQAFLHEPEEIITVFQKVKESNLIIVDGLPAEKIFFRVEGIGMIGCLNFSYDCKPAMDIVFKGLI